MASDLQTFDLYTYFRSSCSARLRIALNLWDVPYNPIFVHLLKDEQLSAEHKALNPSLSVPVLVVHRAGEDDIVIPQSIAALEYLNETLTSRGGRYRSLFPQDSRLRAITRSLVSIIASDIQPLVNLRSQRWIRELGVDPNQYCRKATEAGFAAYEALASKVAGTFSVGDDITLADVCLVPAAWSAARFGVDIRNYPTIARIVERLEKEDAIKRAHWRNQPDTPEEFKQI